MKPRSPGGLALVFAPIAAGVIAFLPALRIGFFRDDYGWVRGALRGLSHPAWLLEPAKSDFRPIPKLTFLANAATFGIDPRGYIWFDIALHTANVALLFVLARRLSGDRRVAFVAALLFAVGFAHYGEAVYWISGRTGLLADLWSLVALVAYDRFLVWRRAKDGAIAIAAFALGLLTKESVVVLPLVLLGLERLRAGHAPAGDLPGGGARGTVVRLLPYGALAGLYLGFQFGGLRAGSPIVGHEFAFGPHVARNFGEYFARMVLPVTPSSMLVVAPPAIDAILGVVLAGLTVIAPLTVIALALRRGGPPVVRFGAAWAVVAILPYVALTYRTSTRYLYGPAQGAALVVAVLGVLALDRLARRSPTSARRARAGFAAALIALVAIQCAVLAIAMERRRAQQLAESPAAQAELEADAARVRTGAD